MEKNKVSAVVIYQDDVKGFNNWLQDEFGIVKTEDDFIDNVLLYHRSNTEDMGPIKPADLSKYNPCNPVAIENVVVFGIDTIIVSAVKLEPKHIDELIDMTGTLGFSLYIVYPVRYYVPDGHINLSVGPSSADNMYDEIIPIVTRNKPAKVGQVSVLVVPATVFTYDHSGKAPNASIIRDGTILKHLYLPKIFNDFQITPLQAEIQPIIAKGNLLVGYTLMVQHDDIIRADEDMLYDWMDLGGDIQINYISNESLPVISYAPDNFVIKSLWTNIRKI